MHVPNVFTYVPTLNAEGLRPSQRNIADNLRRTHAIPADISNAEIIDLVNELSWMDSDELHAYLADQAVEHADDWEALIDHNLSRPVLA